MKPDGGKFYKYETDEEVECQPRILQGKHWKKERSQKHTYPPMTMYN